MHNCWIFSMFIEVFKLYPYWESWYTRQHFQTFTLSDASLFTTLWRGEIVFLTGDEHKPMIFSAGSSAMLNLC